MSKFTDILMLNKHVFIEDSVYLDEIKKKEIELDEIKNKYLKRERCFIVLTYAEAIYEIEKKESDICRFVRDNFWASHETISLEISDKYRVTEEDHLKLLKYIEFKANSERIDSKEIKNYKIILKSFGSSK